MSSRLPKCFGNILYCDKYDEDCIACVWCKKCNDLVETLCKTCRAEELEVKKRKRKISILYWVGVFIICGIVFMIEYFN